MSYGTFGLTFRSLREANLRRLPEFRNAMGQIAHSEPDGSDWSYNDWMTAVTGEVGELANILKKVRRGDFDAADPEVRQSIADEIADIHIYLDILTAQFGLDLGKIVTSKFNRTSEKVHSRVYIGSDGDWHLRSEKEMGDALNHSWGTRRFNTDGRLLCMDCQIRPAVYCDGTETSYCVECKALHLHRT